MYYGWHFQRRRLRVKISARMSLSQTLGASFMSYLLRLINSINYCLVFVLKMASSPRHRWASSSGIPWASFPPRADCNRLIHHWYIIITWLTVQHDALHHRHGMKRRLAFHHGVTCISKNEGIVKAQTARDNNRLRHGAI